MRVEGADVAAAALRQAAALIDPKLRGDLENVAENITEGYRSDVRHRSGRTAAGATFEVRQTADGVEAEVGNTHFVAGFHEYGGARSAPNPALKRNVDDKTPRWVDQVEKRRTEL